MSTLSYIRTPDARVRDEDTATLLVDDNDETIYRLSDLGATYWTLLAEPTDLTAAIKACAQTFPDLTASEIRQDLIFLIEDLENLELIQPVT